MFCFLLFLVQRVPRMIEQGSCKEGREAEFWKQLEPRKTRAEGTIYHSHLLSQMLSESSSCFFLHMVRQNRWLPRAPKFWREWLLRQEDRDSALPLCYSSMWPCQPRAGEERRASGFPLRCPIPGSFGLKWDANTTSLMGVHPVQMGPRFQKGCLCLGFNAQQLSPWSS